jgi:hypothetical protein
MEGKVGCWWVGESRRRDIMVGQKVWNPSMDEKTTNMIAMLVWGFYY